MLPLVHGTVLLPAVSPIKLRITPSIEDNSFKSDTMNGKLEYTVPSGSSLLGVSLDSLIQGESFSFNVAVLDPEVANTATGGLSVIGCASGTNCKLVMSRFYTPILYYLQPRVMFDGSEVDFIVDPKSA